MNDFNATVFKLAVVVQLMIKLVFSCSIIINEINSVRNHWNYAHLSEMWKNDSNEYIELKIAGFCDLSRYALAIVKCKPSRRRAWNDELQVKLFV